MNQRDKIIIIIISIIFVLVMMYLCVIPFGEPFTHCHHPSSHPCNPDLPGSIPGAG